MKKYLKLSKEYIQVRRRENGEITFGGDQGFFKGVNKGSGDERKEKSGCGIIALSDLLLYFANRDHKFSIDQNLNYVNQILEQEEYQKYYNSIYDLLGGIPMKGGISGLKLQIGFNRLARKQGWSLRAKWGISGKRIYERIEEMLVKDIPAILCVPMPLCKKDKKRGLPFYKKEEEGYRQVLTVRAHYVTVTGIVQENDDEEGLLEISSWGKKYYIKWKEYDILIHTLFLGTILGNILYIKENKSRQKGMK